MYGETLMRSMLPKQVTQKRDFKGRVIGQVIDSPIDFAGVPNGLALTFFEKNPPLRFLMKSIFYGYIYTSHPFTMRHYMAASKAFHKSPVVVPSLWFFSQNDAFMCADEIEASIKQWEAMGILCHRKCWENSPHILHFKRNSSEYVDTLDKYLKTII